MVGNLMWNVGVLIVLLSLNSSGAAFDVFEFVDPLIGTLNGGMA